MLRRLVEYRSVSADYRIFSYITLGPKYFSDIKDLTLKITDRSYYPEILKLMDILEHNSNDSLLTEYTSCMINDYSGLKCPPYESWYTQRTVYGNVVSDLMKIYSKYGIYPNKELPDHVSTEMEFASFLYFVSQDDEADNFVSKHILNWVPRLASDITANARGNYTRIIGTLLAAFMESEKERIFGK